MATAKTELLSWHIGSVQVTRVEERVTAVPRDAILPGISDEMLADRPWTAPFFHPDGRMLLSNHSFVIVDDTTTIVVDTCVGTGVDRPLPADAGFLDRLDAAIEGGLDAVDLVLCTHLHFDHVGWNTVMRDNRWEPTFGNARYLVTAAELDHVRHTDHMEVMEPSVKPLLDAGMLDAVGTDHVLSPAVRLLGTPGHTPGHVSVLIDSDGERATITGDAVHSPIQFAITELAASHFDHDSDESTRTRQTLVSDHKDTDRLLLGTHFAPPTAGHLRSSGSGVEFIVDRRGVSPAAPAD